MSREEALAVCDTEFRGIVHIGFYTFEGDQTLPESLRNGSKQPHLLFTRLPETENNEKGRADVRLPIGSSASGAAVSVAVAAPRLNGSETRLDIFQIVSDWKGLRMYLSLTLFGHLTAAFRAEHQ